MKSLWLKVFNYVASNRLTLVCIVILVELELLYHSRGNWIALTIRYIGEDDLANACPSFLHSIREELFNQMRSICQQGMAGFTYSICCQIRESIHTEKHLDIDITSLAALQKDEYTYSPGDAKLYDKFGKRLQAKREDFLKINCWFSRHFSDATPQPCQGKQTCVGIKIIFVSCR